MRSSSEAAAPPPQDVVCTAGHVDHGKSTLVRALTGMEPDRFAEERRRGLTIDLGFAWCRLSADDGERTVAFVDLPGHERFIANMLAGAGPVEATLFVVAADEGWMPQSQEHLDILDLLGVSTGVIAVTKTDTVHDDTVAATVADVRDRVAGTSLEAAPIVTVSGQSGDGMDRLRDALASELASRPAIVDEGRPRLWVDRSFTVKGAGTVVTGTLAGGSVRHGDEVVLLPGERRTRVRGLQSLKAAVQQAPPGSRVAVNLGGIDREEVRRGDAMVLAGQWLVSDTLDVWVRALERQQIRPRGAWHLHLGSSERVVAVRPLATAASGQFVRLTLRDPVVATAGDRFVLREAGRRATVGGGVVVDAAPAHRIRARDVAERAVELQTRLAALQGGDRGAVLACHVRERGASPRDNAAAAAGLAPQSAAAAASEAGLLPVGGGWAHPVPAARWAEAVQGALLGYHRRHPVDRAAAKDVALRAALDAGCPQVFVDDFIAVLVRLGKVAAEGTGVRHPQHAVALDPVQQAARDAMVTALEERPFAPPRLSDAARAARVSDALLRELERSGVVVRLAGEVAMTSRAVAAAVGRLRQAYAEQGPFTASQAKEILGTTRKYALPLLEELDRRGVTRRRGDLRDVVEQPRSS